MPTYYREKTTGKIAAKYTGCTTNSAVFNSELYERFESEENLPMEIPVLEIPVPKSPFELRIEALEKEVGITETESWIDKIRNFLHL